ITVTVHDDGGFNVVTTTTAFDPPGAELPAGPATVHDGGGSTVPMTTTTSNPPVVAVPAGPLRHGHRRAHRVHHQVHRSPARRRAGSGHIEIPKTQMPLPNHHADRLHTVG